MKRILNASLAFLVGTIFASCLWTQVGFSQGTMWAKYSGNPLDLGTANIAVPCVLYDGSMFKMWYQAEGSDGVSRIYYATSPDGLFWTQYGIVLDTGEAGSWDSRGASSPSVLYDGTSFRIWYVGVGESATIYGMVGYATSSDGIHWSKYAGNPILIPGGNGGWDDYNIGRTTVLFNGTHYLMWYGAQPGRDTPERTGIATSVDGISWAKYSHNPVLVAGPPAEWDDRHAEAESALWNGSHYIMWYNGQDWATSTTKIGLATSSDGFSWTKYAQNPILEPGPPGSWDARAIAYPSVIQRGNRLWMFYVGQEDKPPYGTRLGLALSYLPSIPAEVDINPETLNLKSQGKWITAHIELPEGYNVADINVSTIRLNDTIPVDPSVPTAVGDYDEDTIPDLMVKSDRAAVVEYILDNVPIEGRFVTVTLAITGKLCDGTPFQGSDTIRIISPTPRYGRFLQMLEN
jgi:predicted GH43/DUF377 family glycosyl hydrolase